MRGPHFVPRPLTRIATAVKLSTVMLLVSLAMWVPAALMWRMARIVARDTDHFLQTAQPATGTVLDLHWRTSPSGTEAVMHVYPEIAFTLSNGQTIQATTRTGTTRRLCKPGDVVQILYNPSNPQQIDLASQAPRSLMQFGYRTLAIGFAMMAMCGLGLWWVMFRWMGIPA